MSYAKYSKLIVILQGPPISMRQIVARTGLCRQTATSLIRSLRNKHLVRIAKWGKNISGPLPLYQWNFKQEDDAPRNKRRTSNDRRKGREERRKARSRSVIERIVYESQRASESGDQKAA